MEIFSEACVQILVSDVKWRMRCKQFSIVNRWMVSKIHSVQNFAYIPLNKYSDAVKFLTFIDLKIFETFTDAWLSQFPFLFCADFSEV